MSNLTRFHIIAFYATNWKQLLVRIRAVAVRLIYSLVILSLMMPNLGVGAAASEVSEDQSIVARSADKDLSERPVDVSSERTLSLTRPEPRAGMRPVSAPLAQSDQGFVVASSGSQMRNLAAAYDSINNRFLFIWTEPSAIQNNDSIYAQLVSPDGTLIGSRMTIDQYYYQPCGGPDPRF